MGLDGLPNLNTERAGDVAQWRGCETVVLWTPSPVRPRLDKTAANSTRALSSSALRGDTDARKRYGG
jgi:hypothetical protein